MFVLGKNHNEHPSEMKWSFIDGVDWIPGAAQIGRIGISKDAKKSGTRQGVPTQ
ncbi:MAG: hypothetical protein ABSB66_16840 [Candidatus Acidiferrales bacterium]|jgi:hypothetical protein